MITYLRELQHIKRLTAELSEVALKIDNSYKVNPGSVLGELIDRIRVYLRFKKNRHDIIDGYREVGMDDRKYLLILLYYFLTHHTGGSEYGTMGIMSAKGNEAIKLAHLISMKLVEYGYFSTLEEAEDDWNDFILHFKKRT